MDLKPILKADLGQPVGQLRAWPCRLGGGRRGMALAYAGCFDVDPWQEMFYFPTDTLKLAMLDLESGAVAWRRDLGPSVVPGMWFCPVCPFDLDGDGADEVWFVGNTSELHPLALSCYVLERLNPLTGETTGRWPWPNEIAGESLSHMYRHFIFGGIANGEPVLVTSQGTYGRMDRQGWRPDMSERWRHRVEPDDPGARGAHGVAMTDIHGAAGYFWGERLIDLATGREVWCADRDSYRGHSDLIQPFRDDAAGRWLVFTIRESDNAVSPRVAVFDADGRRVWGAVEQGHMDMGWVARMGPDRRHAAMAIRIGHKTCGPDGRHHFGRDAFVFDAATGEPRELPFDPYATVPVDLDGDGRHEFVYGIPGGDGRAIDGDGREIGAIGGTVCATGKLLGLPGEQVLAYYEDGSVRLWADRDAKDSPFALERYRRPFYAMNGSGAVLAGA